MCKLLQQPLDEIKVFRKTVFCLNRKDKRKEKKKDTRTRHTSFGEIVDQQERLAPGVSALHDSNSNWYMHNNQHAPLSAESKNQNRVSGHEPFLVGTSLIKFSQELDKNADLGPLVTSTQRQNSGAPDLDLPNVLDISAKERPKIAKRTSRENEDKMVKLGLIPPRPIPRTTSDISGMNPYRKHSRASSGDSRTTSERGRPSSETGSEVNSDSPMSLVSNDKNWVLMKDSDRQVWESSASTGGRVNGGFTPYLLPEEDYDMKDADWYGRNEEPLYESQVQRLRDKFSSSTTAEHKKSAAMTPKRSSYHSRYSFPLDSSSTTAVELEKTKEHRGRNMNLHSPSIWRRTPEDPKELKEEKINRVKKLGVPILPD